MRLRNYSHAKTSQRNERRSLCRTHLDRFSNGLNLIQIDSHLDPFSNGSNLSWKRFSNGSNLIWIDSHQTQFLIWIDCHHYYYYVLLRLTVLLQLTRSFYPLTLPLPSGRQVTSVVIFPRAYRTSRDILLEFRLFLHSPVCQIYRHERLWSANSLSKTWCQKELGAVSHAHPLAQKGSIQAWFKYHIHMYFLFVYIFYSIYYTVLIFQK